MPRKPESYEEELEAVMFALAETVAEASDEEILEETRMQGDNAAEVSAHVRSVLLAGVKIYQQRHLRQAQQQYEVRLAAMQNKTYQLPRTATEQRKLFDLVLSNQPAMQSALTTQFRDFTSLTEIDVESCLRQFQDLGLLDEILDLKKEEK